jgi:cation diffusion facilitator CzcD-associated flavoprotein CzcO
VNDVDVLILGAGFGGLCMGIQLQRSGLTSFAILERASEVGGTWRDNRYPGCACDVPAALYSYSFAPNPAWSRRFAERGEILAYLVSCADRYGLRPRISFGADVRRASFDEARGCWLVETAGGARYRARVLVTAMGALSTPAYPSFPGSERFSGEQLHSAAWRPECDLSGKRVAVIGTGASAIQLVPQLAPRVAQLDLYQRTPPWVLPRAERCTRGPERALYGALPLAQKLARWATYWQLESQVLAFARHPRWMRYAESVARRHLRRQVPSEALRARLTPRYRLGCKRVLLSNDYYPALTRPNVELVTEPIRELRERSLVDATGRGREVDAIVYGTGFQVQHFVAPGSFIGAQGRDLAEVWSDGPEAYKGTAVTGFPNLFFIVGPNTGLGHSSMVFMIESQVAYVVDAIRQMRERRWASVEVAPAAQASYNRELQARSRGTVWTSGCASWYLSSGGRNTTIWPDFTFRFRRLLRRFDAEAYRIIAEGQQ